MNEQNKIKLIGKKLWLAIVTGIVVVALFLLCFFLLRDRNEDTIGGVAITATEADISGIYPTSDFVISSQDDDDFNIADVKENLQISPAVSYEVKPYGERLLVQPTDELRPGQIYYLTYQNYTTAFQVQLPLAITAYSPADCGGVALNEPIVIRFNQTVDLAAANDITITPKTRGSWSVSENQLIFTPQKYSGGVLYTVTIPQDMVVDNQQRSLANALQFQFETQDIAERIPSTSAFACGVKEVCVMPSSALTIPAAWHSSENADAPAVTADIWFTSDPALYGETVAPLMSLASWATHSREQWRAETSGWTNMGTSQGAFHNTGTETAVVLEGEFAAGYYLCRLTAADTTLDVAVKVTGIDYMMFNNGDALCFWCHENGEALAGATISLAREKVELDERGYGSLPLPAAGTAYGLIESGDRNTVFFPASIVDDHHDYGGEILTAASYDVGDTISFFGYVTNTLDATLQRGIVTLKNGSGDVWQTVVTIDESGFFSGDCPLQGLPAGGYTLTLSIGGRAAASTVLTVREETALAVHLSVTPQTKIVADGAEVAFLVRAWDAGGQPVANLEIASSLAAANRQITNSNGETTFYHRIYLDDTSDMLMKQVSFSATLPDETVTETSAQVTVFNQGPFFVSNGQAEGAELIATAEVYDYTFEDGQLERVEASLRVSAEWLEVVVDEAGNETLLPVFNDDTQQVTGTAVFSYQGEAGKTYICRLSSNNGIRREERLTVMADGDQMALARNDGLMVAAAERNDTDALLTYDGGVYGVTAAVGEAPTIRGVEARTVAAGEALTYWIPIGHSSRSLLAAQLYQGFLPQIINGPTVDETTADGNLADPVVQINSIVEKQTTITLPTEGLAGDYTLRLYVRDEKGGCVVRYWPVQIEKTTSLRGDFNAEFLYGDKAQLHFYSDAGDADDGAPSLRYQLSLEDGAITREGDVTGSFDVDLGEELAIGDYAGEVLLCEGDRVLERHDLALVIYGEEPLFYDVVTSETVPPVDDDYLTLAVPAAEAAQWQALFDIHLLPGSQLLQLVGRADFYRAMGETAAYFAPYAQVSIADHQNNDGSFSRLPGGRGDLLISALIAKNDQTSFQPSSLRAFIRQRLATVEDNYALTLAFWGLSLLGEPPLQAMKNHRDNENLTYLEQLCLSEAFLAAGDLAEAERLYNRLLRKTETNEQGRYLPVGDDTALATLLMADLAIELNREDVDAFLAYAMSLQLDTLTNRYLLSSCLLRQIDFAAARPFNGKLAADEMVLSLREKTEIEVPGVTARFIADDAVVSEVFVGDMVTTYVNWSTSYGNNQLYMLYFLPAKQVALFENDRLFIARGRAYQITNDNNASFLLKTLAAGDDVGGNIYVINLTTGMILGITENKGLTVK